MQKIRFTIIDILYTSIYNGYKKLESLLCIVYVSLVLCLDIQQNIIYRYQLNTIHNRFIRYMIRGKITK